MNHLQNLAEFTTVEEGEKKLAEAIALRNKMGGAMYYNILNDDCIEIARKLERMKREEREKLSQLKSGGLEN